MLDLLKLFNPIKLAKDWYTGLKALGRMIVNDSVSAKDAMDLFHGTFMPTGAVFLFRWGRHPTGSKLLKKDNTKLKEKLTDHAYLQSLPGNSLGNQYYLFLQRSGLIDPNKDYNKINAEYRKARKTPKIGERFANQVSVQHDLMHTLFGYDADYLGEIGIHGVLLKHWKFPAVKLIWFGIMMSSTYRGRNLTAIKVGLEGRRLGRQVNTILPFVDWAELLEEPIQTVRMKFKIQKPHFYDSKHRVTR